MADMVNSPAHYRAEGRKECIEEMIDIFGIEEVRIFCKLNIYKYLYRHDMKNGEQDLEKADRYEELYLELGERQRKGEQAWKKRIKAVDHQCITLRKRCKRRLMHTLKSVKGKSD